VITPGIGLFSCPLWVGRSWNATYSYSDLGFGVSWSAAKSKTHGAAIEDVTVPAGTFKAFRLEFTDDIGTESPGGRRESGSPGMGSRDTYWYAPDPKLVVKSVVVRPGTHYSWAGRTTAELLTTPS
jgi:hypothetical protein